MKKGLIILLVLLLIPIVLAQERVNFVTAEQFISGLEGDEWIFDINGEEHILSIYSADEIPVKIKIENTIYSYSNESQSIMIDFDDDDIKDLKVIFTDLNYGMASFTLRSLENFVEPISSDDTGTIITGSAIRNDTDWGNWWYVIYGIIILAIIIAFIKVKVLNEFVKNILRSILIKKPSTERIINYKQLEGTPCLKCGKKVVKGDKFCISCGSKVEKKKFCEKCGIELRKESKFCPSCGQSVN